MFEPLKFWKRIPCMNYVYDSNVKRKANKLQMYIICSKVNST